MNFKLKKLDILIILILISITIFSTIILNLSNTKGSFLTVYKNNSIYKIIPLNENKKFKIDIDGHSNEFEINNFVVKMIDSNCKDKYCLDQKGIEYFSETIVCLPNSLVLKISKGNLKDNDIDDLSE